MFFLLALVTGEGTFYSTQPVHAAPAATFTVNHANDVPDVNPGDGRCDGQPSGGDQCSLRAAVDEPNALAGNDTIILPAGDYTTALPIYVTSNIMLQGAGQDQTTITSDNEVGQTVFRVGTNGVMMVTGIRFYSCHR
jgi:hypothetical protein